PYYLYCLRLRRLVLIFVNPLYFSNMPSEREIVGNYNCFSHKPAISKNARYAAAFFAKLKG
ncbi:hypothetical protein CWI44_12700, partial [Neisseria meningitidis]